jgi:uroporphyrinogen III methyltransferase/synthase
MRDWWAVVPRRRSPRPAVGKVFLVGGGPGDPGLLTLRGRECLELADVVVVDRLVNPELLRYARPGAEVIDVGKEAGLPQPSQDAINALLAERARRGEQVVRLKGGDAFVFGRGGEEALYLAERSIPFEVVPGVTSAIAAPACAGIPVTHRGLSSSVLIATGHEDPSKPESALRWQHLAGAADTLVFLMAMGHLQQITDSLINYGRDPQEPAALVRWGSTPRQQTLVSTLGDLPTRAKAAGFGSPAVLVVGPVVSLAGKLGEVAAQAVGAMTEPKW